MTSRGKTKAHQEQVLLLHGQVRRWFSVDSDVQEIRVVEHGHLNYLDPIGDNDITYDLRTLLLEVQSVGCYRHQGALGG